MKWKLKLNDKETTIVTADFFYKKDGALIFADDSQSSRMGHLNIASYKDGEWLSVEKKKDHEIADLVSRLTQVAKDYCGSQQLRERIRSEVMR